MIALTDVEMDIPQGDGFLLGTGFAAATNGQCVHGRPPEVGFWIASFPYASF